MDEWQISQHEPAAVEMCYRLNKNPYEPMDSMAINSPPLWVHYARRMAEHELMVQLMRQSGRII